MRYFRLRPYGEFERIAGQPLLGQEKCSVCGRASNRGETSLVVRFADAPPYPDALSVLFGPEWAISPKLYELIAPTIESAVQYASMRNAQGSLLEYRQVILQAALRAGHESIRGGEKCEECGGYVQLDLEPLYVKEPDSKPPIAFLLESPGIVLIREDVSGAIKAGRGDVDLLPILFEGESGSDGGRP